MGGWLTLLLVGLEIAAVPTWSYSRLWGFRPAFGLGTLVIVVLVLQTLRRP